MEATSTQTNLSIIQSATPPAGPSAPRTFLNMMVALFLGTGIACAAAVAFELLDRRVRTNEDVYAQLGAPLVGVLLKTENAPKGLLTRRAPPWVIHRNLPAPTGLN
jgi:capsular polysaccharide biosynthesis protein